ncbi:MAG: glycosyltransferase [Terracidiphilus sp.]|jgi:hypothetical protein
MISFIQPFGLHSHEHGGSQRIFQSLLDCNHPPVLSIDSNPFPSSGSSAADEIQLPSRPNFGWLEYTRLQGSLGLFDRLYRSRFEARLRRILVDRKVKLVHVLPHGYFFQSACRVASELGIPYFLSVHDDLGHLLRGHPFIGELTEFMGKAWREARGVFAISDEIGLEYCRRYGAREYRIVTDGLKYLAVAPQQRPAKCLRLYFMGLFHLSYAQNLRAVLDALRIVRSRQPDWEIAVTCRSGKIAMPVHPDDVRVTVLPFAPAEEVDRDMLSADLLYQPMPFEEHARLFSRFSLSTKMITYLGSGLPIFYHGPDDAAACTLLARHEAAVICTTLDPEVIADLLLDATARREAIVQNALALARSQFMLVDQQRRFWEPVLAAL